MLHAMVLAVSRTKVYLGERLDGENLLLGLGT